MGDGYWFRMLLVDFPEATDWHQEKPALTSRQGWGKTKGSNYFSDKSIEQLSSALQLVEGKGALHFLGQNHIGDHIKFG